jgi:hypothetical protein
MRQNAIAHLRVYGILRPQLLKLLPALQEIKRVWAKMDVGKRSIVVGVLVTPLVLWYAKRRGVFSNLRLYLGRLLKCMWAWTKFCIPPIALAALSVVYLRRIAAGSGASQVVVNSIWTACWLRSVTLLLVDDGDPKSDNLRDRWVGYWALLSVLRTLEWILPIIRLVWPSAPLPALALAMHAWLPTINVKRFVTPFTPGPLSVASNGLLTLGLSFRSALYDKMFGIRRDNDTEDELRGQLDDAAPLMISSLALVTPSSYIARLGCALVGGVLPAYSSLVGSKTREHRSREWLIYWTITFALSRVMEYIPLWPHLKLALLIWLHPCVGGASRIFELLGGAMKGDRNVVLDS